MPFIKNALDAALSAFAPQPVVRTQPLTALEINRRVARVQSR